MADNEAFLQINGLRFAYGAKQVLPALNLNINRGDFVCLLGPSGSGKTTLLRLIAGLEPLHQGTITLGGVVLSGSHDRVPPDQRGIGMMFQQPTLFPNLTVAENIAFGIQKMSHVAKQQRVDELLDMIGLKDHAASYPHALSGGQQHRVALARSLAPKVKLLLLDEPFSHLDPQLRLGLSVEMRTLLKAQGVSCLMVTHDASEAMRMGDKIALFDAGGALHQYDTPEVLYHHPRDAYVAQALGDMNIISAACAHALCPMLKETSGSMGVRPHDVWLNRGGVNGQVKQVHSLGRDDEVHVQLESGEHLRAYVPYGHAFSVGQVVQLSVLEEKIHRF